MSVSPSTSASFNARSSPHFVRTPARFIWSANGRNWNPTHPRSLVAGHGEQWAMIPPGAELPRPAHFRRNSRLWCESMAGQLADDSTPASDLAGTGMSLLHKIQTCRWRTRCASGERRTKRGKDAGRPNSSAIWPTEDAASRRSAAARRAPRPTEPGSRKEAPARRYRLWL